MAAIWISDRYTENYKLYRIPQDGEVEGYALIFSCENSNITTCCWTTVARRMLDPTRKKIPHVQGQRRSPSKIVGRAIIHLESNPIPTRDAQRAQTKPCVHQETPQRLNQTWLWVFECLLQRYRSAVACQGQGLWVQPTWVRHKHSWRRSPLTPTESLQNLHRTGETDTWRA